METKCVPLKFTIGGKEVEAFVTEKDWQFIINAVSKSENKTGYERVPFGEIYWRDTNLGYVKYENDECADEDEDMYKVANYYSSEIVAKNNVRADTLIRQLRRFAVEHREYGIDWHSEDIPKWSIFYDYSNKELHGWDSYSCKEFASIYFDSEEAVELAIEVFRNELIWYFTEYKDSL